MRIAHATWAWLAFAVPVLAQTADDINAAIDALLGDHEKYRVAFDALQVAVANEDAEAVAALAAYPLIVKVGERQEIADEEAFVAGYGDVMTDEIVDAVTSQTWEGVFANDQGLMFGNGQVWLAGVCTDDACTDFDVKIITIQSTAE